MVIAIVIRNIAPVFNSPFYIEGRSPNCLSSGLVTPSIITLAS
jgi:hypothetical protein